MKKLKRNIKPITILILLALLVSFAVYGLISLIGKLTSAEKSDDSSKNSLNSDTEYQIPEDSANPYNPVSTREPVKYEKKEIKITFNKTSFEITNSKNNFSASNHTGTNELTVFVKNSTCEDLGFKEITGNSLIEGYSISEENNGILLTASLNRPFTFIEKFIGDDISLGIFEQINSSVFEYRNDLSRVYLTIQKARLSNESDSFIKNYTEIYDEAKSIYTITIAKNLMPVLKDEVISLYDGIIKTIEISNRSDDIQLKFEVYEKLSIYPNTRDYDAAFTFIKQKNNENPLIVLDPGHGGIDGGTVSADETIIEKNIVLQMCSYLSEYLKQMGFEVINLREEDVFLGLMERTDIANIAKADAIISVHINSYTAEYVNGAQTYYKTSDVLAAAIHNAVLKETGANDMGTVKTMELSILNRAEMESVIVETGFLTNDAEAKLLNTKEYQEKVALGIAKGIAEYFGKDY